MTCTWIAVLYSNVIRFGVSVGVFFSRSRPYFCLGLSIVIRIISSLFVKSKNVHNAPGVVFSAEELGCPYEVREKNLKCFCSFFPSCFLLNVVEMFYLWALIIGCRVLRWILNARVNPDHVRTGTCFSLGTINILRKTSILGGPHSPPPHGMIS